MLLTSWLLLAYGVWGSWIWAAPAGLRVLGLDLAEYVKFMAEIRSGQIAVTREVFYLPLLALSLSLSFFAHRREVRLASAVRWLVNLLAVPCALALLPPAWTPSLLTTPEFVKQTIAIGVCVLAALLSYPVLRSLPRTLVAGLTILLSLAAIFPPLIAYFQLRPAFDTIYGQSVSTGFGAWASLAGSCLLGLASILFARSPHPIASQGFAI
jgi:hypothetical protein